MDFNIVTGLSLSLSVSNKRYIQQDLYTFYQLLGDKGFNQDNEQENPLILQFN